MISLTVNEAANVLAAAEPSKNVEFTGVSTDTRTLRAGNLFVALDGPNHRGSDFIPAARAAGAVAAVTSHATDDDLPQLYVDDTLAALGKLARHWRRRFALPVIAITGSNGKTTSRSLIAACCGARTLATEGNLNNEIGVPLTLFRLSREHERAVIEMGANHQGEIARLAAIAEPAVGIVTNAGPAHLEGFGGIEGVANGKGELFKALGRGDVAVINDDDVFAARWREFAEPATVRTFGSTAEADVWFDGLERRQGGGIQFRLHTPDDAADIALSLDGRHNAMNAAGAAAVALAVGIPLATIAERLQTVGAEPGRQRLRAGLRGASIIDDSYNANPASMRAGAETLVASGKNPWMAIGDMGELGEGELEMHAALGASLARIGVKRLFTVGSMSAAAAEAFGVNATHFDSTEAMTKALADELDASVALLVKGSRSAGMERVVARLVDDGEAN